jgi:hypothetical protein
LRRFDPLQRPFEICNQLTPCEYGHFDLALLNITQLVPLGYEVVAMLPLAFSALFCVFDVVLKLNFPLTDLDHVEPKLFPKSRSRVIIICRDNKAVGDPIYSPYIRQVKTSGGESLGESLLFGAAIVLIIRLWRLFPSME